jgi:hypothetical protein
MLLIMVYDVQLVTKDFVTLCVINHSLWCKKHGYDNFRCVTNWHFSCSNIRTTMSTTDSKHMHRTRWDGNHFPGQRLNGGTGFRDLTMLNQAMLGKLGWTLISREDSLCARVLKGRYFNKGNFLSIQGKKHASQTWRAILAEREA